MPVLHQCCRRRRFEGRSHTGSTCQNCANFASPGQIVGTIERQMASAWKRAFHPSEEFLLMMRSPANLSRFDHI